MVIYKLSRFFKIGGLFLMSLPDDYHELKHKFTDDVQDRYESIRPILLFEDISIRERAKQTGSSKNTIKTRVRKFKQSGMRGLFDSRELPKKIRDWNIPQNVIDEIFELLSIYPDFKHIEICKIINHTSNYKLTPYQVKTILNENPYQIQTKLSIIPTDPYELKVEVVKRYYLGWHITTLEKFYGLSRRHIQRIINNFEKDNFAGLLSKSKAPHQPHRKVFFPIISKVYQIQKENPKLGSFRVWGLLKKRLKYERNSIEIGHRTVARIMSANRDLYPELIVAKEEENEIKEMPFKFKYRHHYWFIDIRYLIKIDGKWIYSICILEGYSRCILSGMVSLSQDLWAVLIVLYSAILRFGIPTYIVSDNAAVFISSVFKSICQRLDLNHKTIKKRHPWENLIESFFGIQARMTDYGIEKAESSEEVKKIHEKFLNDYNTTDHWGLQGREDNKTIPSELLGWVKGRPISEEELHRKFYEHMFQRTINHHGCVRLQNFYFYIEDGLATSQVYIWVYQNRLLAEHNKELLIEYECSYDEKNRKIQELSKPVIHKHKYISRQLKLFEFTSDMLRVQKIEKIRRQRSYQAAAQLRLFEDGNV
jgi:transposase InsO family protein